MRANELNEATLGGALWDRLNAIGQPGASLSLKDRMIKRQFLDDLVGRAATNIEQGIQGGIIDPNPGTSTQQDVNEPVQPIQQNPATAQQNPATAQQNPATAQQKPAKDELGRVEPTMEPPSQAQPQSTPAKPQTGYGKVSYNVPTGMTPAQSGQPVWGTKPAKKTAPSPEQIRIGKQKAATANVQQSMLPYTKLPSNQYAKAASNVRQDKQALAGLQAQVDMLPQFQPKRPATTAKVNYNKPAYQRKGMKGPLGESILNEAYKYTISSYLQTFLKSYMPNVDTSSLKPMCDDVMAAYGNRSEYKKALQQLASASFAIFWNRGMELEPAKPETPLTPQTGATSSATSATSAKSKTGEPGEWERMAELLKTMGSRNKSRLLNDLIKGMSEVKKKEVFKQLKNDQIPKLSRKDKRLIYDLLKQEFAEKETGKKVPTDGGEVEKKEKLAAKRKRVTRTKKATEPNASSPGNDGKPLVATESKSYKVWGQK